MSDRSSSSRVFGPLGHQINLVIEDDRWVSQGDWDSHVIHLFNLVLDEIHFKRVSEVNFLLGSDEFVQNLNHQFRGLNKPTNVLSFPGYEEDELELFPRDLPLPLGDIALAYETIAKESEEQGKSFLNHSTHLIIHGVLHLLGYDHEEEHDAEEMEQLEIDILKKINICNPYED